MSSYIKELAREICEELGIAWNVSACEPTLRGVPISEEDIGKLFSSEAWSCSDDPFNGAQGFIPSISISDAHIKSEDLEKFCFHTESIDLKCA